MTPFKVVMVAALLQGASAVPAEAPTLLRPLQAGVILTADDFDGEPSMIDELVGLETRRFMPAGSVVRPTDIRAPILVSRNSPVRLQFAKGALAISAEGRALSSGALGESVRVMSLYSKKTLVGVVAGEGLVQVR